MITERTLAIIKPDAVAHHFIGKILALIEDKGLRIIAAKMLHLSTDQAKTLYLEHQDRPFFNSLIEYMTSGPVMVHILEGENAISILRDTMGATLPVEAKVGTIRNLYARHECHGAALENAIHGSDSIESAAREMDFFFTEDEVCPRTR